MGYAWKDISSMTVGELEDIVLYLFLMIIIFLEFVNSFIFPISQINTKYFPAETASMFFFFLLTARIIMKKMDKIYRSVMAPGALEFNEAIDKLLKEHPMSSNIDIFAKDSTKFCHGIEDHKFHVNKMRILINEEAPLKDAAINNWKTAFSKGFCREFIIKTYNFTPSYYAISIDRKYGFFGFFNPEYLVNPESNKTYITGPYLISDDTQIGRAVLGDFQSQFDEIFDKYSKDI